MSYAGEMAKGMKEAAGLCLRYLQMYRKNPTQHYLDQAVETYDMIELWFSKAVNSPYVNDREYEQLRKIKNEQEKRCKAEFQRLGFDVSDW